MISRTIRWLLNLQWSRMRIFTNYLKFIDHHNCQYSLKKTFHLKHCIDLWPCIWQQLITWSLFSVCGHGWHYTIPRTHANKITTPKKWPTPSPPIKRLPPYEMDTPSKKHSTRGPQMKWIHLHPPPPKKMDTPPPPRRKDYPQIEWIPLPKQYYTLFIIMTLIYRHSSSRTQSLLA